jgi:hypothetical protein
MAMLHQAATKPGRYELNLCSGPMVLVLDWEDSAPIHIVTFKRGDWEHRLLALDV